MLNYTSLCLLCIHLLQCISLCFVCCKGIENIQKQKISKMAEPMSDTRILRKPRQTKKNKITEPISQYPKPRKTKKTKKTRWQNLCPSIWHGVSTFVFLFFLFFEVFAILWEGIKNIEKPKKSKWQNLCPSIWHGVSTFVFLFFSGFLQYSGMWHGFCHFVLFAFFCFCRGFCKFSGIWHGFWHFAFLACQGFCNIRSFLKTLVPFPKKIFFS